MRRVASGSDGAERIGGDEMDGERIGEGRRGGGASYFGDEDGGWMCPNGAEDGFLLARDPYAGKSSENKGS